MFGAIAKWLKSGAEYRRAHDAAFAPFKVVDAEGVTMFQRRMISELEPIIPADAYVRAVRPEGLILEADIPRTSKRLYLFPAEAGIALDTSKPPSYSRYAPYEEWDFRTPEQLIDAVKKDVRDAA